MHCLSTSVAFLFTPFPVGKGVGFKQKMYQAMLDRMAIFPPFPIIFRANAKKRGPDQFMMFQFFNLFFLCLMFFVCVLGKQVQKCLVIWTK